MADFSGDNLEEIIRKFHEIEHDADKKKHEMMGVLVKPLLRRSNGRILFF